MHDGLKADILLHDQQTSRTELDAGKRASHYYELVALQFNNHMWMPMALDLSHIHPDLHGTWDMSFPLSEEVMAQDFKN